MVLRASTHRPVRRFRDVNATSMRRMRLADALSHVERPELSQKEAAGFAWVSERGSRRWRDRHRKAGLDDRFASSPRRTPAIESMPGLYRDLYRAFMVSHFHGQLAKRHNDAPGDIVTKPHLHHEGLARLIW